jgi:hypothetical protein
VGKSSFFDSAECRLWYAFFTEQGEIMKRAVLYLGVSTLDQTTANQERELRQVAERAGWQIVRVLRLRSFDQTAVREWSILARHVLGCRTGP